MTHERLIEAAHMWLCEQCPVVLSRLKASDTSTPDVIGWINTVSIMIECIASRSEYSAFVNSTVFNHPQHAVGTYRYFFTGIGLLAGKQPRKWGILEFDGDRTVRKVRYGEVFEPNREREVFMLATTLRRLGSHVSDDTSTIIRFKKPDKDHAILTVDDTPPENKI